GRATQSEQQLDGSGLACPVASEETDYRVLRDIQVEILEGLDGSEGLAQPTGADDTHRALVWLHSALGVAEECAVVGNRSGVRNHGAIIQDSSFSDIGDRP